MFFRHLATVSNVEAVDKHRWWKRHKTYRTTAPVVWMNVVLTSILAILNTL